jgi:uncharacterized protein YcbK (DUF882 family)
MGKLYGTASLESRGALCTCRRGFLKVCALGGLYSIALPVLGKMTGSSERTLSFFHTHTGERLHTTFWADGRYEASELTAINRLLRDHYSGQVHTMDPALLNILYEIKMKLGTAAPFHVISGYRSGQTNRMLQARGGGVAKRSLHMEGQAIDIRIPGVDLRNLRRAAVSLRAGGVGMYSRSQFVHVDTGRVRVWGT